MSKSKRVHNRGKVTAEEFDELFEKGDVTPHLDFSTVKVHVPMQRELTLIFPSRF